MVFKDLYKIADFEKHRKNLSFSQVFPSFLRIDHSRKVIKSWSNCDKSWTERSVTDTTFQESPETFQFSLLVSPGLHFGRGWATLGRVLAVLAASWTSLGSLLGAPWVILGVSWVPLGSLGCLLGASWAIWNRFWKVSGRVWEGFG